MERGDSKTLIDNASDTEIPDEEHSKLLKAINQLDNKQRIKPPTRNEPSLRVSEFNLAPIKGSSVHLKDLAKSLESRGKAFSVDVASSLRKLTHTSHTLPKPLEKPVAEKIQRSVGYTNLKKHVSRWEATVEANRVERSLSFPINLSPVRVETSDEVVATWKSQTMTPLEAEINEILGNSKVVQDERKEQEIYKLTLAELKEKRKEMAKIRAQQSYFEAKARRVNKIKSKRYHRIQRREQMQKQLKDFEVLQKTDPEAALKQLEQLERTRAEERMTLRHRSTGQWARSRLVRAKYDPQARQQLAEQLAHSRDLTKKVRKEDSSDEEADDQNAQGKNGSIVDPNNPWMTVKPTNEIEEFVSGYRKYWEEKNTQMKESEEKANMKRKENNIRSSETDTRSNNKMQKNVRNEELIESSLKGVEVRQSPENSSELIEVFSKKENSKSNTKIKGPTVQKSAVLSDESKDPKEGIEDDENSLVNNTLEDDVNECSAQLVKAKASKKPNKMRKSKNTVLSKSEIISAASNKRSASAVKEKMQSVPGQGKKKVRNLKDRSENSFSCLKNLGSVLDGDENYSPEPTGSHKTKKKKKIVQDVPVSVSGVKLKMKGKEKKKKTINGTEKNVDTLGNSKTKFRNVLHTNNEEEEIISAKTVKTKKRKRTTQLERMFDQAEAELASKIKKKLTNLKQSFKGESEAKNEEQDNKPDTKEEGSSLALRRNITQPNEDLALDEAAWNNEGPSHTHNSAVVNGDRDILDGASKYPVKSSEDTNIDPSNFIKATPKLLITAIPDLVTSSDYAIDNDEPSNQQMTIAEAFADDDVMDDFRKEKEDAINKSKPQNIDLTLPGWGSWGGVGIKPESKRKKRRFIIRAPNPPPRRDQKKPNVIIDEEKAMRIPQHQVSELPFPFTSVKDFEASIRAPLGKTWMPQIAHQLLIQPKVVTKSGVIIKPMHEDVLVNKKSTFNIDN